VVNEVDVKDKAGFQTYAANQETLIKKYGGQYIIRGGKVVATLSGTPPSDRFTVYRFDSQEKMQAWRDDPAQKDGLATRDKVGKGRGYGEKARRLLSYSHCRGRAADSMTKT
jgi:uncharacterized protein (DUF1330 family)